MPSYYERALTRCAILQGCPYHGGLSDAVLVYFASPLLGPCKVQQLNLTNQRNITGRGIAALAGGRFPGGFSCALSRLLRCSLQYICAYSQQFSNSVLARSIMGTGCCAFPHCCMPYLRFDSCFAALERLILDGTGADDEVLPLLAPLARTLEHISVLCPSDDKDEYTNISWEGVQVAMEAFARCGGEPEIQCML